MKNILVADDSPTMRQLILFALRRLPDLTIAEANDGVAALKKLSSDQFDLLITDINMPIMDGLKLINLIRNDSQYESLPIIVITTEGASEDREKAMALGANEFIAKPIQTARIIGLARQLLFGTE